jgi:hypothetical protein
VKKRLNILACALVIGAFAAPAAQAAGQRPPVSRHHAVAAKQHRNAFTNLGHEGSGLQKSAPSTNAFTNLGNEGSGLTDVWVPTAAALRPWA